MEDPEAAAVEAAELARLVAESAVFASRRRESGHMPEAGRAAEPGPIPDRPTSVEDLIVTNGTGYHLLRFVESAPGSSPFVHLWLDRDTSNLALARLRLQDLAGRLGQGLVRQGPR
ncbi:hypothetical protein [Streptomyces sp. KLOTTS4A1]|uniref:hypothetical protein n=1 Tax=Streptomyces sp. KLOTTS4A1 TaxID=3390996 RepID=UPI0039F61E25